MLTDIAAAVLRVRDDLLTFGPVWLAVWLVAAGALAAGLGRSLSWRAWLTGDPIRLGMPAALSRAEFLTASLPALALAFAGEPRLALLRVVGALSVALLFQFVVLAVPALRPASPGPPAEPPPPPRDLRAWSARLWPILVTLFDRALPAFLIGSVAGAIVATFLTRQQVAAAVGPGAPLGPWIGALVGGLTPLCCGGDIPLAWALLTKGVGAGTLLALLAASPVGIPSRRRLADPVIYFAAGARVLLAALVGAVADLVGFDPLR